MPTFSYRAIDPQTNNRVSVSINASSQNEANRLILERGLRPLSVKEVAEKGGLRKRIKRKDKIIFTNQLATLINAGLPLLQALKSVTDQIANRELKKIISEIINSIESGNSFSDSLARYPKVFDQIFINLIKAGEASGGLDVSLERLAVQQEKDGELVSKIKRAMVYPVIVVLVMVGVVVFMLVVVLPQVENFYQDLDAELPFLTQALLGISNSLQTYWMFYIIGVFAGVGGFYAWAKSEAGSRILDSFKLKAPLIKDLYSRIYMARFTRTMGTLFGAGVNLIESLAITQRGIGRTANLVQEGSSLSSALRREEVFLDLVPDMVKIGEDSGKTEEMLIRSADYYEKEVDKQIGTLTTLMEPIMILTLGGIAILIVAAILWPIYGIVNQNLSGQ